MLGRTEAARWGVKAVAAALAVTLLVACNDNTVPTSPGVVRDNSVNDGRFARGNPPRIRHVFVIALENESYAATFGPGSPAPYLADSLPARGALLTQYFGTGHYSLDNYISMISGQAPDSATSGDCGIYADFVETGFASDGQAVGAGCVYPANVRTIADQLGARGLTWRGYMEDMGSVPGRESATCVHVPLGRV